MPPIQTYLKPLLSRCMGAWLMMTPIHAHAELIVLASPTAADNYYASEADKIFDFHIAYAKQILTHDEVLIFTDQSYYADYVAELGQERVRIAPMADIWMRDFTTANPIQPVMFRYSAAGQGGGREGQESADLVQEQFYQTIKPAGLPFRETDLINDGGNVVDDGDGNMVVSRKFLRDNRLSEQAARKQLQKLTGARHIAFIEADEQGGLEHADGVVSFIGPNRVMINSYPEDPNYAKQLRHDLESALPGVTIHTIITPYDGSETMDARFGSACGLYTNALVTPERIYFPQFGIPEDATALKQVRSFTDKEVVPVSSQQVCHMGGGVRCMSWQLRGESAQRLLKHHP
uniref:Putative Porphyromonas-type peptidyl-arginine deiminase n=1 Tax=Magnetococcus massalia (strain MO-1) TaxID=451514 RepID=A0A1S7LHN0_MAGMO|nr:putative Porphyromonas-type peptidyl-arginine deiminase [Candidatus Magnetococcus massalia]